MWVFERVGLAARLRQMLAEGAKIRVGGRPSKDNPPTNSAGVSGKRLHWPPGASTLAGPGPGKRWPNSSAIPVVDQLIRGATTVRARRQQARRRGVKRRAAMRLALMWGCEVV